MGMLHELAFRVFEVPFENEANAAEEFLVRFGGGVVGGAWHRRGWRLKLDGLKLCLDEKMLLVGEFGKAKQDEGCGCRWLAAKWSRPRVVIGSYGAGGWNR